MDPIQRKITPNTGNIQGPQETTPPGATESTGKKFDLGSVSSGQSPAQTAATGANRPIFDDMASFIRDAAGKSQSRDQVRQGLIEHETQRAFGDQASPQLTASISNAFASDPHLSQVFNQLYTKATQKNS